MAKPDLGNKRQCSNCGTKFFDLNKSPITCPKCGTIFEMTSAAASRSSRAAPADDDDVEAEDTPEVVPLEDADATEDGKVTAAATEDEADAEDDSPPDDDDDTFLEEEEDDGDVSDLIDGDVEDDEER